ncbi:DUF3231 family protein [Priestia endophytica]|uniref:DUF3231 family protein n=1 Tax=Priestia filamentosa TaxID=1402861 RepID=UPI00397DA2FD
MSQHPSISSSEIGVLWITYQQKTMVARMLEYFIGKAEDDEAKKIMKNLYEEINPYIIYRENTRDMSRRRNSRSNRVHS